MKRIVKVSNLFNYYLVALLFGYLAVAPLSHILYSPEETSYVAVLYRFIMIIFTVYFISHQLFVEQKLRLTNIQRMLITIFFMFVSVYFIRILYDSSFQGLLDVDGFLEKLILFGFFSTLLPAFSLLLNKYNLNEFLKLSCIFLCISIFISLIISFSQLSISSVTNIRFSYDRLNSITLGHAGVSLFIISLVLYSQRALNRYFLILSLIIGFFCVVLSGSRGAILSFFLCIFSYLIITSDFKKSLAVTILSPIIFFLSLLIFSFITTDYNYIERLMSTGSSEDKSASIRYEMYKGAYEQFSSNPIFGDFSLEREYLFYPHNQILEILMATGVVGFLLYLVFHLLLLAFAIRKLKTNFSMPFVAIFLLYIQALSGTLFSGSVLFTGTAWFFSLLLLLGHNDNYE